MGPFLSRLVTEELQDLEVATEVPRGPDAARVSEKTGLFSA
jgi:hypothetical protein